MKKKFDVYGMGNAIIDIQAMVSDREFRNLGLKKAGMTLVDADTQQGLIDRIASSQWNKTSGGSAANTMIALASLGSSVAYDCMVGEDSLGNFYLGEMKEIGVTIKSNFHPTEPTGTCLVAITPDAERTMATHLGASAMFSDKHVNEDLIEQSNWVYIEGYLFTSELGQSAVKKAIKVAKKSETKIAVTFSDGFVVERFNSALKEVVENSELIFANFNEGRHFTKKEEIEDVFEELQKFCPNVVMTLSEAGSLVKYGDQKYKIKPVPTVAVDDTGAGDIFAAAFLYGVCNNWGAERSGNLASLLSSKVVSKLGPRLTDQELKNLVKQV
jgi:sugar/nucleoside kinase (ribokinase family)